MDYVPHTPEDLKQIMKTIGISSMDDLFDDIPEKFKLKRFLSS